MATASQRPSRFARDPGARLQQAWRALELTSARSRVCSKCHLALNDELVSKAFQGRHGRAFLFGNVYAAGSRALIAPTARSL
jgi:hypothetical protein